MAVPPTLSKDDLRGELRIARRKYAAFNVFFGEMMHIACVHTALEGQKCVAGYLPTGGEPDVRPLLHWATTTGATLALPQIDSRTRRMRFLRWHPDDPMEAWRSIPQPCADAPEVVADVILAPLLGFDRALNRLGQGGGFYDRAFAAHPDALKIGIAWSVQEVAHLPTEPHDIKLDAVLTEKEWITL